MRIVKKTLKGDLMGQTGFKSVKPAKLRKSEGAKNTFFYDGVTVDPRFDDLSPRTEPTHPAP